MNTATALYSVQQWGIGYLPHSRYLGALLVCTDHVEWHPSSGETPIAMTRAAGARLLWKLYRGGLSIFRQ